MNTVKQTRQRLYLVAILFAVMFTVRPFAQFVNAQINEHGFGNATNSTISEITARHYLERIESNLE